MRQAHPSSSAKAKVHSSSSSFSSSSSASSTGKENFFRKEKDKDKDEIFKPKMNMAVQALTYQNKNRPQMGENEIEDDKLGYLNYATSQRNSDEYKYENTSKSAVR